MRKKKTKIINLPSLLNKPYQLYEKFHTQTKLPLSFVDTPEDQWPKEWKRIAYKAYSRLPEFVLPAPEPLEIPATTLLYGRNSHREFGKKPLSKNDLSTFLHFSAGTKSAKQSQRFYPSAGARYPLEVYLLTHNTEFENGLYHYYVRGHSLEKLLTINDFSVSEYFNQKWLKKAACIIIITAVFKRSTDKYGDRGYKMALLEAGHLAQNMYLISPALDLNCCSTLSFYDDKINSLIDIDGVNESTMYCVAIGNKS